MRSNGDPAAGSIAPMTTTASPAGASRRRAGTILITWGVAGLVLNGALAVGAATVAFNGIDGFDLFKGISGFEGSPGFAFSGGLEDFGPLLKLIFPGLGLGDVTTSFQTIGATKAFVFDLTFTLPSAAKEFSLDALDLSNGGKSFPLALEGDGSLQVAVDGTIKAKVGWNLATMQPILDPASFRVSLTPLGGRSSR